MAAVRVFVRSARTPTAEAQRDRIVLAVPGSPVETTNGSADFKRRAASASSPRCTAASAALKIAATSTGLFRGHIVAAWVTAFKKASTAVGTASIAAAAKAVH